MDVTLSEALSYLLASKRRSEPSLVPVGSIHGPENEPVAPALVLGRGCHDFQPPRLVRKKQHPGCAATYKSD